MGHYEMRLWLGTQAGIDVPRADRWQGRLPCYVPEKIFGRDISVKGSVSADVSDGERAIAVLDSSAAALTSTEGLARLLLRAEAVASSHIEGLVISPQRILRSDLQKKLGRPVSDLPVREIIGNIDALHYALSEPTARITIDRLNALHEHLLDGTRAHRFAGRIRTVQNWIGGASSFTPKNAEYVPPPPDLVEELLEDLCAFANDDALPPLVQAAVAHAQFETIHPYVDGNGRTGRALIYMILRRRGLALRCIPPVSLVLATFSERYVSALQATRQVDPATGAEAVERWIAFFAAACRTAVRNATDFESRVERIVTDWKSRVADLRADAAAHRIVSQLSVMPMLTARSAQLFLGTSYATANNAIGDLVAREILAPRGGDRNRTFEASELIDAFADLERALASSDSNTRISPPTRPVPARRRRVKD